MLWNNEFLLRIEMYPVTLFNLETLLIFCFYNILWIALEKFDVFEAIISRSVENGILW